MRFAFTDEQLALRQGAEEVLEGTCTPADIRAIYDSGDVAQGRSDLRWSALNDLGVLSLLAGEDVGGLGFGDVELVGVLESGGAVCLPEAVAIHAGVAVPLLQSLGASLASRLSEIIAGGNAISVGGVDSDLSGPVVRWFDGEAHAERVEGVSRAAFFLLASANDDGVLVSFVPREHCVIEHTPSLDITRDLGTVTWTPTPPTTIASGDDAAVLIDEIASRSAFVAAAELCGVVDAMVTETALYTKDRQQFGSPIGSFQSIKHLVANVRVGLEFARPAVYRAAWSFATQDDRRHHDAALAKALASELGLLAASTCLQVHGGIGYTWEHDLQFSLKRCWALASAHGDAATQRARAMVLGLSN